MPIEKLRMVVLTSLMAALMAVGAYIHIPIGPVPIVLTNLFVLLSGLLLGNRWGLASAGLYLLVGAIGMPVFYGGKGGFAHILGPTGGYLFGFAFSAWITGFISERFRHTIMGGVIAVIIGSLAVYGLGVPWLKMITKMSWNKAWMVGMLPFLLGDGLKAVVAIVLARAVRPMLNRQTQIASTLTPTLSHQREREREQ
ncbi:MAG: biotin transporter BioY [Deltaproteobacteria bacterium]|nr:biotin transporter BioY [Deltaproteobacteria bacterium]